jgi:hypothetical protein
VLLALLAPLRRLYHRATAASVVARGALTFFASPAAAGNFCPPPYWHTQVYIYMIDRYVLLPPPVFCSAAINGIMMRKAPAIRAPMAALLSPPAATRRCRRRS